MPPTLLTRIIYALALGSVLLAALAGSSGWIALMLGGGVVGTFGWTVFGVIAGLIAFRVYQVLRYREALAARVPNALGKFLRVVGWMGMFVGALAGVGFFLVKPITLLVFKTAGDAGIGYLAVGLVLIALANLGWLGCLLFEVSRACGPPGEETPPWARRKQDFAVLGVLIAGAVFAPQLVRGVVGEPCGANNLAACVSTTDGEVRRIIALPLGEAVGLESNLGEIEMRSTAGRKWSLVESPHISLAGTGHPVAANAPSGVRARLQAKRSDSEVVLEVVLLEGSEQTARFVTRFPKGAKLEDASGGLRLVIDLPANAESGMRSMTTDPATGKQVAYDQLFVLFRSGIGSASEAAEWDKRVELPAVLVNSDTSDSNMPADTNKDPACDGRVELSREKERAYQGNLGMTMKGVTFKQADGPGPHALMGPVDRLICREGEFWIISYWDRRPDVRLRRYDARGKLVRFVDTTLPPLKKGEFEYDLVDSRSLSEERGRIRFERVLVRADDKTTRVKKREVFELAP